MTWYNIQPRFQSKKIPKQIPIKVISSRIGEKSLVGNWLFYNGTGDILYDFSSFGNHGRIEGAEWMSGPFGWSLYFHGGGDWVNCGNDASVNLSEELSVGAWLNAEKCEGKIVNKYWNNKNGYAIDFRYGYLYWLIAAEGTLDYGSYNKYNELLNEWHFLMITYKWDGKLRGYVDDFKYLEQDAVGKIGDSIKKKFLGIGGECRIDDSPRDFLHGSIARVVIFSKQLNDSEEKRLYEETKGIYVSS